MSQTVIVMAVYRPTASFLAEQIASIAAQTLEDIAVVFVDADQNSSALIEDLAGENGLNFHVVVGQERLDAVRAFEFGLKRALDLFPEAEHFALSDQDDIWCPQRLAMGVAGLRDGAVMTHSDARMVDALGRSLHASVFGFERRDRGSRLRNLLVRNSVTGMTATMTRAVVENALPFPPQNGVHFYHDLWLALVARVMGEVRLIRSPLVDYRQHGNNAVGAGHRGGRAARFRLRTWAGRYALASYLARQLVLRFGNVETALAGLEPLKPYLAPRSAGLAFVGDAVRMAVRGRLSQAAVSLGYAVVAVGRTIWSAKRAASVGYEQALGQFDSRLYDLAPGVLPRPVATQKAEVDTPRDWTSYLDTRCRCDLRPVFGAARPSLNILLPSLNPNEMFAGILTAVDMGVEATRHGVPVRFIATDLPVANPQHSRMFIQNRDPDMPAHLLSVVDGSASGDLPAHPGDRFVATAWWTAYCAKDLCALGYDNADFAYLIQDFEPGFYAWGQEHGLATASYDLNFTPIFNTSYLRRYFAGMGYGFADQNALTLRPAIVVPRYASLARSHPGARRQLALYGRPEVSRNMFPLAVESIAKFLTDADLGPADITVVSAGMKHSDITLPNGVRLHSLGKLPLQDYPSFLSDSDVGLALMYSPHPSHLPIEMAAAGVKTVTNAFSQKDLSTLAPHVWSTGLLPDQIAQGLRAAWNAPSPRLAERNLDLSPMGDDLSHVVAGMLRLLGLDKKAVEIAA